MKNLLSKRVIKNAYLIAYSVDFELFSSSKNSCSQTNVLAGDIAFRGVNCDGIDNS